MSSPKRDSGISADMSTDDDSKIGSVKDIMKRFESHQTKLEVTKQKSQIDKPNRPEVPKKPLKLQQNKKSLIFKVDESYQHENIYQNDRSSPSIQSDKESIKSYKKDKVLKGNDTMLELRQKQPTFCFDIYAQESERVVGNRTVKKLPVDKLNFMEAKLQRVYSSSKQASNENSKISYDCDETWSDGFDDSEEEIYSEPFIYEAPLSRPNSSSGSLGSSGLTNLQNVIRELLKTEETYIVTLEHILSIYMQGFDRESLPSNLQGKRRLIFGKFEDLLQLHKQDFGPKLTECGDDTDKVSMLFISYLKQDKFYVYVLYAMRTVKIQEICRDSKEFFDTIQNECGDKLGISSYLMQPIQRFLRYPMLLSEMINQLKKQNDQKEITQAIANCSKALYYVERFCNTLNEVQRLKDIEECFFIPEDHSEPFILKPTGIKDAINLNIQGKFLKMAEYLISDCDSNSQFKGILFLFEKIAIYTQITKSDAGSHLKYVGHYDTSKLNAYLHEESKFFDLWESNQPAIKFKLDSKNTKEGKNMFELLKKIVAQNESPSENMALPTPTKQIGDTIWNKTKSFRKKISNSGLNLIGSKNDSELSLQTSFHKGHVKEKLNYIDSFQNAEETYIQNLIKLKNILFEDWYRVLFRKLYETCKDTLSGILALHQQKLQPVIKRGNEKEIIKHFEIHLGTNVFDLYQEFAVLAGQMKILLSGETEEQSNLVLGLIMQPLNRMKEYSCIFEEIDKNFESSAHDDDVVETQQLHAKISTLSTHISKIHQRVQESFLVNCLQSKSVDLPSLGQVLYSDLITLDKQPEQFRLFILEKSVLCMSVIQKEFNETYDQFIFGLQHKNLKLKEERSNNKFLKINQHKVQFSTAANRGKFVEQLNKLLH